MAPSYAVPSSPLSCWIAFHSFEAGIAYAISSFKLWKNIHIYEQIDISNIELLIKKIDQI